jgi:hypothetical protein
MPYLVRRRRRRSHRLSGAVCVSSVCFDSSYRVPTRKALLIVYDSFNPCERMVILCTSTSIIGGGGGGRRGKLLCEIRRCNNRYRRGWY